MQFRVGAMGWAIGALALLLSGTPVAAQGPPDGPGQATVAPVQDLRFGVLFPGASIRISPADVGYRGEVQVEGQGRYEIRFILPSEMVSPGGATLPLGFGDGDATLVRGTAGTPQSFNPAVGTSVTLDGGVTEAQLFLGGTASPTQGQLAGTYTANITVLIARN